MSHKYSVIIPTLNEEYFLEENLRRLKSFHRDLEIIISDGGSTDNTLKVAERFNCNIVNSKAGRGMQLNAGAKISSGEILIFLHADSFLPDDAFKLIDKVFENESNLIATFKLGFDFQSKLINLYTKFSKYDFLFTRFGDSGIIVRKDFFYKLNGFADRESFEDVDFFKRASRQTKIFLIDRNVVSSARRFITVGIVKQQLLNILLFAGYILGMRSNTLHKMYNNTFKRRKNSIIVFLRYPKAGKVKTRLANTTSSEFATRFYKSCAENIIRNVKKIPRINRFAFYSNVDDKEKIISWLGGKLIYSSQQGDDLGSRMKNAFEKVFSTGSKNVIIVGTDIPDLSEDIIRNAFNLLDKNDVVIGPSKDGGYYLLGMKKMYPELFEGIDYSTSSVFDDTISVIKNLQLSFQLLAELQDIDTEEDLIHWLGSNSTNKIKHEIKVAYETI